MVAVALFVGLLLAVSGSVSAAAALFSNAVETGSHQGRATDAYPVNPVNPVPRVYPLLQSTPRRAVDGYTTAESLVPTVHLGQAPPPGINFYQPNQVTNFSAAYAWVYIRSLKPGGATWFTNDTNTTGGVAAMQLSGVAQSSAGVYWVVFDLLLNQSPQGYFVGFRDSVWNQSAYCAAPGATGKVDEAILVQGKGSVVTSFPGCYGTHYQYTSKWIRVTAPLNVSLAISLGRAAGAFGVGFEYNYSSPGASGGGLNDNVTVYPGHPPSAVNLRVGGATPLGFAYDLEWVLTSPVVGQNLYVDEVNATAALFYRSQCHAEASAPGLTYDYGADSLSGLTGASSSVDLSGGLHPWAELAGGAAVHGVLWPVHTYVNTTVFQGAPGSNITLKAFPRYFNTYLNRYEPLPEAQVAFFVNGSLLGSAASAHGVATATVDVRRLGVGSFNVSADYPASLVAGSPRGSVDAYVSLVSIASSPTPGSRGAEVNLTAYNLTGAIGWTLLGYGSAVKVLVPPQGVEVSVPPEYENVSAGERIGFQGWYAANQSLLSSYPSYVLLAAQVVKAVYSYQFLVTVVNPYSNPRESTQWVAQGSEYKLTAPRNISFEGGLVLAVFHSWSNGSADDSTVKVDSPLTLTADYTLEYKVVAEVNGTAVVDGYYPNNSILKLSAPAVHGGSALYPDTFQYWGGTITSYHRTLRIRVTQPLTLNAVYAKSYQVVTGVEFAASLLVGAFTVYLMQKKRI